MQLREVHMRTHTIIRALAFALLTMAGYVPRIANAQSICESCEAAGRARRNVSLWGNDRPVWCCQSASTGVAAGNELGLFRITTQQVLHDANYPRGRVMAESYWGLSKFRAAGDCSKEVHACVVGFGIAAEE